MKQEELVKGLKVLGTVYGKEFTQEECAVFYEFLNEYSYDAFKLAIKSIVRKSKFMPKVSEIIEECEEFKERIKFDVIEFMNKCGYFKDVKEYDKATKFMVEGNVPGWLQADINEYYKKMQQEKLEYKSQLLI